MYKGFWTATATLSFASINSSAWDSGTVTIAGIKLGDHIVSWGLNQDPEAGIFFWDVFITSADTVTIGVYNESGSGDTPAPTEIKLVIGRPQW
jgi:hypothetical protein